MGQHGRKTVGIIALCGLVLLDPLLFRSSRIKLVTGETRLKAGIAVVQLSQADKFKDGNSYWVGVTAVDSSTAQTPDSVRTFVIKNFASDRFTIRSVKYSADTIKVRWIAQGR